MLQKRSLLRGSTHNFELFAWFERHWVLGEPRFFWFLKCIVSSCRFPFSCCSPLQFQFLHQQISFLSVKSNHNVTGCNPQFWWFKSNFPWWNMFFLSQFVHNFFATKKPPFTFPLVRGGAPWSGTRGGAAAPQGGGAATKGAGLISWENGRDWWISSVVLVNFYEMLWESIEKIPIFNFEGDMILLGIFQPIFGGLTPNEPMKQFITYGLY